MTARIGRLERHIQEKYENREWLEKCLRGKTKSFPYRPNAMGEATVSTPFRPVHHPTEQVTPPEGSASLFLANIPMRELPAMTHNHAKCTALFKRICEESFGATSAESAAMIKNRVAVVLGINQIKSIDPELNRSFRRYIRDIPPNHNVVSRIIGFFWEPQWEATKDDVYPIKKAFLLLKALDPAKAEKIRKEQEQPRGLAESIIKQIPFQSIRQTIKNSGATRSLISQMEEDAPNSPIYFTLMDDDLISLRGSPTNEGVFSRLEALIAEHDEPSIASLGYSLEEDELPLLRLAVKMDMAVRSTMPMPYFPEPFTAIKVRRPGTANFLRALTFIGAGKALESRRLIESGLRTLNDGAVFSGDGGVVTATPYRMKTIYNQTVDTLTPQILKKKASLQALRGRRLQTHAFPKQWADILYAGLGFRRGPVTDVTGPMMHIFSVYDPISRMFDGSERYTSAVFNRVMKNYNKPLSDGQTNLLNTAKSKLRLLGMKKAMVDLIQETAKRSGSAILQVLSDATH